MDLKRVSKKAILNMFICAVIWAVLFLAISLFVWFGVILVETQPKIAVGLIYWGLLIFIEAILLVLPFIRWYRYRYAIDENRIVKSEGIVFITTEIAPIERVHQISVMRGPIDRLTGLAKVIATTAGGEIVIRFLEQELAEELAARLEKTIKRIIKRQGDINAE